MQADTEQQDNNEESCKFQIKSAKVKGYSKKIVLAFSVICGAKPVERIKRFGLGFVTIAAAIVPVCTTSTAAEKILLGSHIGSATILSISGVNTDSATVLARRELDDSIEMCAREARVDENGSVDSQKIAECSRADLREARGTIYRRRALCSRHTIYTEFGNYSLVHYEKEAESNYQGKPYRPIRTDWKDHRTEKIVGNCGGCNTPQILNTFEILCPRVYRELFSGYDPY